ncbi:DnaD domain-containing protein [Bacillaceae bacterium SIJ1]|uniref:DnaD domain-containing protein n=1 Tax=Litoribacterium kuwaitense TaxID=1398745 RepID=UPI0013EBCC9B|nr:DnaD domain-containing protein [Litoribacterium kuwaitense]NGP43743.1 DnaD domain-containing protein [Litoribacterium kuwaitense]
MNEKTFVQLMQQGSFAVPSFLITSYSKLGLNDHEWVLIMHIWHLQQRGVQFPSPHELSQVMSAHEDDIQAMLASLIRRGLIDLKDDLESGDMKSETLSLEPLFKKCYEWRENMTARQNAKDEEEKADELFGLFEQEFGRALSPIEYETLSMWVDKDDYSTSLIKAALREAVLGGKLSFRYIDRILFEWQKNQVKTVEDAQKHAKQFRDRKRQAPQDSSAARTATVPFYNWLE